MQGTGTYYALTPDGGIASRFDIKDGSPPLLTRTPILIQNPIPILIQNPYPIPDPDPRSRPFPRSGCGHLRPYCPAFATLGQ